VSIRDSIPRLVLVVALLTIIPSSDGQSPAADPALAAQPGANPKLELRDGTPISMRTNEKISSAKASVGDRVQFRVTEDVKVGDLIVIRRGSQASGAVTALEKKARKGKPGNLQIQPEKVQLLTGQDAPLRGDHERRGQAVSMLDEAVNVMKSDPGSKGPVPSEIILLPMVPFVLLEKGKDAVIPAETPFTAFVNGDIPLDRAALESAQPPVVHRSGPATVTVYRIPFPPATAYRPSVYCGKVELARISRSQFMKLQLPPGHYNFESNDFQPITVDLAEGDDVYLELQMVMHGMGVKGHLVQVSVAYGEDTVNASHASEIPAADMVKLSSVSHDDLLAPALTKK